VAVGTNFGGRGTAPGGFGDGGGAGAQAINVRDASRPCVRIAATLVRGAMQVDSAKPPIVIGIAGGTGSGKTTVSRRIAERMKDSCVLIEHDSYYRDLSELTFAEREKVNFDHPASLETELLVRHLEELKAGRAIEVPVYDYANHGRKKDGGRVVAPAPIVIVEGILVFVEAELRAQMDIKVFVDTDPDIRVLRRVRRDMEHRGRTFQSIRDQYYATVRPMHLQFVEPSKRWADVIVPEGGKNEIALDMIVARLAQLLPG